MQRKPVIHLRVPKLLALLGINQQTPLKNISKPWPEKALSNLFLVHRAVFVYPKHKMAFLLSGGLPLAVRSLRKNISKTTAIFLTAFFRPMPITCFAYRA